MSPGWVSRLRFPRGLYAISKMRRAPRRVLWQTESAILRASLAGRRAGHISVMIRVKDEEEWHASAKLVMRFTGANVHLGRQHLKAAASRVAECAPGLA